MKIIVDTREQNPFAFQGSRYDGVEVEFGTLGTGDYLLEDLTDRVAVERKSLDDLIGCLMGSNRERFERELQRATEFELFRVVVEASWSALVRGEYQSKMKPHSACQSVIALSQRYNVPFDFAWSRVGAEYLCWSFLRHYLENERKRLKEIARAHGGEK